MTYAEVKNRLSQVETALQSLQSNNLPSLDTSYVSDSIISLQTIQETLTKQLKVLEEGSEETMFISTKGGDTKAVKMDRKTAMDLKKDPSITGIDTAKGASIKEQGGVRFSVEDTKAIAKRVGKALVKAIVAAGDQIARIKAHRIEEDSFDIHVIYKGESGEDEFSFYIKDDTLHLADFTFTKKLVKVGVKPSGDAIVNVDVLANELLKHFRSLSEEVNDVDEKLQEAPRQTAYIKVAKADYRKTMSILDSNIDPTYVKMDVVDDDGNGDVIIYFNFKHEAGFDDMYDDSENRDSEFYQEPNEDPSAFVYDVAMDLRANDIPVRSASHDIDEDVDNSDWASKVRTINQRGRNIKAADAYRKSPEGKASARSFASSERKEVKAREIVRKLKIKRAQVEREMENDPQTEPTGGPVSDMYGDQLNKIDNAIEKAASVYNKPMDYDTAVGKANESFDDDSLFTFGFDLDEIQYVVDYLKANYSEQDYELHVGRGDTHPNAVTLNNPEMEKDAKLGDLLDGAKGSDQTDYEDYRKEEDDYLNNELEETEKVNESASRDLDEIFGALGYRQGFDEFIEDNPGCVEVIMEWIGGISDFQQKLSQEFDNDELENLGFYFGDDQYDESTVKEGRGDLDIIQRIVSDMADEDGTTPKEAALEIIEALRDIYIIDAYDEGVVKESLNPEVSNKVNQFIKAMAKKYGYEEQDAVYAIMAALKQRDFDGVKEGDGLWANINAKKKRGEKASHGNSKAFKAAKKAGKSLARTKESILREFTDNDFSGAELIKNVSSNAPDMFGKQIFSDLLPKGVASENDAIEALKKHDKSGIKARMGQYAPMFVHMQYHSLEHEGEKYRMHQKQYYNSNFKDNDPDFNPGVSKITLMKVDENDEGQTLGTILVKTDQYVQDLRNLPGLGKRVSEEANSTSKDLKDKIAQLSKARAAAASSGKTTLLSGIQKDISKAQKELKKLSEATRQDLGMSSSVSKRRAKAELKKPGNDGSKVYGLDKDGKRVHIKNINDVDKFKKFELDADLKEGASKEDQLKIANAALEKAEMSGDIKGAELALAAIDLIKKEVIKEEATCCGKCGRVHVKGNCKRPYLKGAKHCRTK